VPAAVPVPAAAGEVVEAATVVPVRPESRPRESAVGEEVAPAVADLEVVAGGRGVGRLAAVLSPSASSPRMTSWPSAAANPWCAAVDVVDSPEVGAVVCAAEVVGDVPVRVERPEDAGGGVSAIVIGRPITRPPAGGSC
jgi:hypothetical protein